MQQDWLNHIHTVHFVGIGGSGMSPLAEILHQRGYTVTGSDIYESDNLTRIRALGITVNMPQTAANIENPDLVVYTAAVSPDNPELKEAGRRGIPLMERAELLGLITRQFADTVAVAGTHGKTTTTSMIAQILLKAKRDPSVIIGGRLPLIEANGRAGRSQTIVCEACEFRDHYLQMRPHTAIILNIDADHLDYFGDLNGVIASFEKFARLTDGTVILNTDDPNAARLKERCGDAAVVTVGTDPACDWAATDVTMEGAYARFHLLHGGEPFAAITLGVPGRHNVLNAACAAAAAYLSGATATQIADGIASFTGAGRRFEKLGTVGGVLFVDDYAHHPTEITATIAAAKKMATGRVLAVFQPFTFSRTARHLDDFAKALSAADVVAVSDIMGSREINTYGVSSQQITDKIPGSHYLPTFADITDFVVNEAKPGDIVLTMGGGDIYKCARMIKAALEKKVGENA